jgi:hypothetical protein
MRALTLSCVAALVLACGADAAQPVLTHTALVTRADRICDRYAGLLQRPTRRGGTLGDPAYDAAWLRLFAAQRTALAALRANRRDTAAYRVFLQSLPVLEQAARDLMSRLERRRDDRWSRAALSRFLLAHAASARRARAVGMRRCPGA